LFGRNAVANSLPDERRQLFGRNAEIVDLNADIADIEG